MKYDVIVVGSGQAGVPLATRYAGEGRRTALIERAELGGTCVNRGCTPTKTMVASARAAHVARNAGRLGVQTGDVRVDLSAVVDRKNAIVEKWREGIVKRLDKAGESLHVLEGHGRFSGEREIAVNGDRISATTIILNVGARPTRPAVHGLDDVDWLDSSSIMDLREAPDHLLVLGGGYIGCEFGQMFRRFGARVTIVNRAPHLLDREDEDVSEALEAVFRNEGIDIRTNAEVMRVERARKGVRVTLDDGSALDGSHLLVAVGRSPNTDDLGCAAAGITLDRRGFIAVDERYRTSAAGVYAVGDVTGGPQFTHTSWDDHRILYELLERTNGARRTAKDRLVPFAVFTDPQIARVGLSEREAKKQGIDYEIASMPFGHIARAIELDETAGILKVLIDPKSERFLGAAIAGLEAGELIHVFVALMQAGATARAIVDAEAIHPTLAEGLQTVLLKLERYRL
jgi:pyruvate/2-oxoglutarate dehydrogenase complex dihydrolipoamide dehydrogenase (E3) component